MSKSGNHFPAAPRPPGSLLDARLHLLDRQLLDHEGEPVGIVDDLDLDDIEADTPIEAGTPAPHVTGILTGQVLITRILGGQPPRGELHPVPWRDVAKIGTVVALKPSAQPVAGLWLEHWLREHVIGRIPGGRHAAE